MNMPIQEAIREKVLTTHLLYPKSKQKTVPFTGLYYVRILWLGRQSLVKTFDEESLSINDAAEDIKNIRLLLDQDDIKGQV